MIRNAVAAFRLAQPSQPADSPPAQPADSVVQHTSEPLLRTASAGSLCSEASVGASATVEASVGASATVEVDADGCPLIFSQIAEVLRDLLSLSHPRKDGFVPS